MVTGLVVKDQMGNHPLWKYSIHGLQLWIGKLVDQNWNTNHLLQIAVKLVMVSTTSQYADTRANNMSIWTDGKSSAWRSWMNMIGPSGTGPVYIRKNKLVISMPSGVRHGAGPSPGTNLTTNIFCQKCLLLSTIVPTLLLGMHHWLVFVPLIDLTVFINRPL